MERTNWRSATAYQHVEELDTVGLAFEYLRRNPSYVDDALNASVAPSADDPTAEQRMRRWCLCFRRRSTESGD